MSASGDSDTNAEFHRELYSQFRGPLIAFFMNRVTNRSEAEDLTQETFLRLINSVTLDRSAPPSGYVFRIAANLLADRGRAAARRQYVSASTLDQGFLEALTREVVEDREPERVL
jgi:DNA-directed RNA polymerase specialized sigma24 family protein